MYVLLIESKASNGSIINECSNTIKFNAITIDNYNWDKGQQELLDFLSYSSFLYLSSSIHNGLNAQDVFLPNQVKSIICSMSTDIKIGVICITTVTTTNATRSDLTAIYFFDFYDSIMTQVSTITKGDNNNTNQNNKNNRKSKGENAILLIAIASIKCLKDLPFEIYDCKARTKERCRESDDLYKSFYQLPKDTIDLVIGRHLNDIVHHWINVVVVVVCLNKEYSASVMYFPFDAKDQILIKEQIEIEWHMSFCNKIFINTKQYILHKANNQTNRNDNSDFSIFSFHNLFIEKQSKLSGISVKWKQRTNEAPGNNGVIESLLRQFGSNER